MPVETSKKRAGHYDSSVGAKNITFVPESDLCTGCGTCAAICPQDCIEMGINRTRGVIEPVIDMQSCTQCGLCVEVCPGWHLDFSYLRSINVTNEIIPYLGQVEASFIGWSGSDSVRINAASGGMVSEVLLYLLEQGEIDGAIVTRMNSQRPLEAEAFIARSREEILSAQRSKYCPVSVCSILKEVLASGGRYAFVGLPCHVAGLRRAQLQNRKLVPQLPYVLGLFCSRTPNINATRHLLYNTGIDPEEVQSIAYRGDGHPGRMRIRLKNGSESFVEHLDYRYWGYTFLKYFKPVRCWLCPDHSAAMADISFADNWMRLDPLKGDSRGSSTVVARNSQCADLLRHMAETGQVVLHPIPAVSVAASQELAKKSDIPPRIWIWRRTGHFVPELDEFFYNHQPNLKNILYALPEFARVTLSARHHRQRVMNILIRCSWALDRTASLCRRVIRKVRRVFRLATLILSGLKALSLVKEHKIQRSNMHKVVMIGGYGGHDIGDEAMPHTDVLNLRANISDLEIVMCSPDPEYTREFHGERSIHDITGLSCHHEAGFVRRFQVAVGTLLFLLGALAERLGLHMRLWPTARSVLDEIASADLLFNVGGGNLNSVIPTELYKKCTTYLAARILKKPVILSGQTIGPFTKRLDALYARFCLNRVNTITFRDRDTSYQRLRAIGVSRPVMCDAADDAMTLPPVSRDEAENLLRANATDSWWDLDAPFIAAMNMKGSLRVFKGEGRSSGLEREADLMAKIADALVQVYGAKLFFLPTDYCRGVDDREVHRDILSRMKCDSHAICVEEEYNDAALKGIIALADIAIGVRYHFAVFAASSLVPFLGMASGVYQQTKLKGLADLCGLPRSFVSYDMEFASFDEVWPKVQEFISEKDAIASLLAEKVPLLNRHSLIGIEAAIRIMS